MDAKEPADAKDPVVAEGLAGAEESADVEEPADAKDLVGKEEPANLEKAVVIYYKHQY